MSTSEKRQGGRIPEGKNTQSHSAIKRNDRPCGNIVERNIVVRYSNFKWMSLGYILMTRCLDKYREGIKINNVDEDSLINSKNKWNYFQIPRAVVTHGHVIPPRWDISWWHIWSLKKTWTIPMPLTWMFYIFLMADDWRGSLIEIYIGRWSSYEIIYICTAVVDESEEWSSQ